MPELAEAIARITYDCPLATVIGAFLVAKDHIPVSHLKNAESFRLELLRRFRNVIAGNLGDFSDTEPLKKLLKCIALLQPIHPDDEKFKSLVEKVEGLPPHDTGKFFRLLANAGVLFKRGRLYRLSPDLLADFIIQDSCFGVDGTSTGYAESILEKLELGQLKNFLLNLGKLDWRLFHLDSSSNRVLDAIWGRLKTQILANTVESVTAVAPFQPERALRFAEVLIRNDAQLEGLPRLLKYVAYDLKYLRDTCLALWELRKRYDVGEELHRNPGHPVRILKELCAVEPHKPIEYNHMVVEFALSLLSQEDAWESHFSPLDILEGIFQLEGYTTTSKGSTITMSRYRVCLGAVTSLRAKARDAVLDLLSDPNRNKALRAARFIEKMLQIPIRGTRSEGDSSAILNEFEETFGKLRDIVKGGDINELVLIEILRVIQWHRDHSPAPIASLTKEIAAAVPQTLTFRTLFALVSWGFYLGNTMKAAGSKEREIEFEDLAKELRKKYPNRRDLLNFIRALFDDIERAKFHKILPTYQILGCLFQDIEFTRALLLYSKDHPKSNIAKTAAYALTVLFELDHREGYQAAMEFKETGDPDLLQHVARAYSFKGLKAENITPDDLEIIRILLTSRDFKVVEAAVDSAYTLAKIDKRQAIDLLLTANFASFPEVAHKVLMYFYDDKTFPFDLLKPNDIKLILEKLVPVPEIDDYWIQMFLSKSSFSHSELTADFFMARVEKRITLLARQDEKGIGILENQSWKYRVCISDISPGEKLRFRESVDSPEIMKKMWEWMRKNGGQDHFLEQSGELFFSMFGPLDIQLIPFLENKVEVGTPTDAILVSHVLSHADSLFVFKQRSFVQSFLEKAEDFGKETYEHAFDSLYQSATGGLKRGIPGEPFPEDVRMRDESEKALSETPRFSSAYPLYETLKKHAEWNIKQTLLMREVFEEDEL